MTGDIAVAFERRGSLDAAVEANLAGWCTVRIAGPILLTNPFYERPEVARHRKGDADGVAAKLAHLPPTQTQ